MPHLGHWSIGTPSTSQWPMAVSVCSLMVMLVIMLVIMLGAIIMSQEDESDLNRRLRAVDWQLRRSETTRRQLETSHNKLLGFAQVAKTLHLTECK